MDQGRKNKFGYGLIIVIPLVAIVGLLFQSPIVQDLSYHVFADRNELWKIPNGWNTLSNFPFLIVGLMAIYQLLVKKNLHILDELKLAYLLLFCGVTMVALGSGYYHWSPDNTSLVWDRLPMTIAFMALFSIVIAEFISIRFAKFMLWPFVAAGITSVMVWYFGEAQGEGDLRLYVLVQFLPILIMPVIFIFFEPRFTCAAGYWWLLVTYLMAKLFEHYDGEILELTGLVSGHSIKHVLAAVGLLVILKTYQKRCAV